MIDRHDTFSASGSRSMVAHTVGKLTNMSLAAQEGDYLGAEADILVMLGISRPTLRQAAKVVESDRLIEVRRGAGGGFYVARPTTRDAIQAPALWLKLQSATLEQMNNASRLIFPQASALAAACEDPALIAELRTLREDLEVRRPGEQLANETVEAEVVLNDLLGRMAGDPVVQLFMSISYSFGLLDRRLNLYRGEIARRLLWLELQRRLCDAILAGDADLAARIGRERGEIVGVWIASASDGVAKRTGRVLRARAT